MIDEILFCGAARFALEPRAIGEPATPGGSDGMKVDLEGNARSELRLRSAVEL
jgi:hypothetical protein